MTRELIRFLSSMTINLGPRPGLAGAINSGDPEEEVPDDATGENHLGSMIARAEVEGLEEPTFEEQEEQETGEAGEAQYSFLDAPTRAAMTAMLEALAKRKSAPDVAHITFDDASGRLYWLYWEFCKTWTVVSFYFLYMSDTSQ